MFCDTTVVLRRWSRNESFRETGLPLYRDFSDRWLNSPHQ